MAPIYASISFCFSAIPASPAALVLVECHQLGQKAHVPAGEFGDHLPPAPGQIDRLGALRGAARVFQRQRLLQHAAVALQDVGAQLGAVGEAAAHMIVQGRVEQLQHPIALVVHPQQGDDVRIAVKIHRFHLQHLAAKRHQRLQGGVQLADLPAHQLLLTVQHVGHLLRGVQAQQLALDLLQRKARYLRDRIWCSRTMSREEYSLRPPSLRAEGFSRPIRRSIAGCDRDPHLFCQLPHGEQFFVCHSVSLPVVQYNM